MAVNPLMTVGVHAVQQGLKGMNRAAQDVAELNLDDRASAAASREHAATTGTPLASARRDEDLHDAAEAITDLRVHARQVQLAARVVKTADEVLGFLIDVRA